MSTKINLPTIIKVSINKDKSGVLIAELPEYDIFTQSDSLEKLVISVNDLVYTYFDIPKKDWGKVRYLPPWVRNRTVIKRKEQLPVNPILFKVLTKPSSKFIFK